MRLEGKNESSVGGLTDVPNISAPLIPINLTMALENKQDTTIRQKVRALAALISSGRAAPPAPREFIAPQIPGAARLQRPRMVTFVNVDRYHFTWKKINVRIRLLKFFQLGG